MRRLKRWGPHGVTFLEDSRAGGRTWRGGVNENELLWGGAYHPFLQFGDQVRHHNGRIDFNPNEQAVRDDDGQIICPQIRMRVEVDTGGGNWQSIGNPGTPTRNLVSEGDARNRRFGEATVRLDFPYPSLLDSQRPLLQGFYTVGRRSKTVFGFRFRSPVAGRYRLVWRMGSITRDAQASDGVARRIRAGPGPHVGEGQRVIGLRFRDLDIHWTWEEALYHTPVMTATGDPNTRHVDIVIGPATLAADEVWAVRPQTFGPTATTDAEEGSESEDDTAEWQANYWDGGNTGYLAGHDAGGNWSNGPNFIVAGWLPDLDTVTPGVASIDTGTEINAPNGGDNTGTPGNITARLYFNDAATPAVASGTNLPSNMVQTVEAEEGLITGSAVDQTWACRDCINELVVTDGNDYEGTQRMIAILEEQNPATTGAFYWNVADENSIQLTIQYTAAGGAEDFLPYDYATRRSRGWGASRRM